MTIGQYNTLPFPLTSLTLTIFYSEPVDVKTSTSTSTFYSWRKRCTERKITCPESRSSEFGWNYDLIPYPDVFSEFLRV